MDFKFTENEKAGVFEDPRIIDLVIDYHDVRIAEGEAMGFSCQFHYHRIDCLKKLREQYEDQL